MQEWMGMPLTATLVDEGAQRTEADAVHYQLCLQKLGISWEQARAENVQFAIRFEERAKYFLNRQAEAAYD
jgi:hypothetical protein